MGYTNSPLVVYTKLSPNHSGQRTHSIDRITPHCVVGQLSAESICGCFTSTSRQASCNYGIGTDGRVSLCVEEKNRSWCSSSNANDQRAVTIECASDMNEPYAMNSAVYDSLVKLCIDICKRNGKKKLLWLGDKNKTLNYAPAADEMVLTVHRWFANKSCPGNWLYARLGDLAAKVTAALGGSSSSGMQASSLKNLSEAEAVAKIGPLFTANQKTTGILACVSMAQFILESGYSYPVWRCKRKAGERDGEPPKNGSPDQKMYSRSKKGCMSNAEKEAADKRCPSEIYHECALEQSFMELLYSMKRDYEQNGEASTIMAMFNKGYEQLLRQAKNNSISVQRVAAVNRQIEDLEERLQDVISHQVEALREAALEQSVELNERLSNGEITLDEIDTDIRSGLTPGSIGTSFYDFEAEEGSEAQIYTELVRDLQERLKTLRQERQTIEEEQGDLATVKKNFEFFLACLKELPDANSAGMPLKVNGLDVQGTLMRDAEGNPIEGRTRAITSGKLKVTPERIAEAPDMLHFEKGIYCAFIKSGVLQGDVAIYKTNFGVTLTTKGNRRTLNSFMGYKRCDLNGTVVYVDAPYKVYGFSIQYRRYLTTAAKRERGIAV